MKTFGGLGGSIAQWFAYLLLDPAAPGSIPSVPEKLLRGKIVNVAEASYYYKKNDNNL